MTVFCVLTVLVSIAACSMGTESPTKVTEKFLTAVQEKDSDAVKETYAGGTFALAEDWEDSEESDDGFTFSDEMTKELENKIRDFSYEVSDEKITEDKASVDVKIKTYDFGGAFSDFFSDYMNQALALAFSDVSDKKMEKLANTLFETQIDKLTKKTYTETVKVKLTKSDGKWMVNKVSDDGALVNALSGGMIKTFASYADAFSDEDDND